MPVLDHGQGTLFYSKVPFGHNLRKYGEHGKGGQYVNSSIIMSDIYKSTEVFAERSLGKLPSLVGLLYTVREKESRGFANIDKYARAFNGIQIDSYE